MTISLKRQGNPITSTDVAAFENELGESLPNDYREFLVSSNGGVPEGNRFRIPKSHQSLSVTEFLSLRSAGLSELSDTKRRMADRVPSELLPFATAEGGNLVCIAVHGDQRGTIFFWDHESESDEGEPASYRNLFSIAESFSKFWAGLEAFDSTDVELDEDEIEEAWINPDLLKRLDN